MPYSIRYLSVLLLVFIATRALSQQVHSTTPDSMALFPKEHGTFENYLFILNGSIIGQHELADYPEARLDRVLSYNAGEMSKYQGVVYFHTPWYPPSPADQYADDPAYFINGIQVSPYAIRASRAEDYIRIEKSEQDTVIDGTSYRGSIHVYTEEDFFANRIALPELIEKYTGLPPERVIVHWRGRFIDALNPGVTIQDHFPLYYVNPKGLQEVKIDRMRFAEGERYFVHVVDQGYRFSNLTEKGWRAPARTYFVFDDVDSMDPTGPCYLADFDTTSKVVYRHADTEPQPFGGTTAYLKKLSTIMGLSTDQPKAKTTRDSITVQFIVLANGQLTGLESLSPRKTGHDKILQAIKQHSCVWSVPMNDRKYIWFRRKMTLFYDTDRTGNIGPLHALEYRYDDAKP